METREKLDRGAMRVSEIVKKGGQGFIDLQTKLGEAIDSIGEKSEENGRITMRDFNSDLSKFRRVKTAVDAHNETIASLRRKEIEERIRAYRGQTNDNSNGIPEKKYSRMEISAFEKGYSFSIEERKKYLSELDEKMKIATLENNSELLQKLTDYRIAFLTGVKRNEFENAPLTYEMTMELRRKLQENGVKIGSEIEKEENETEQGNSFSQEKDFDRRYKFKPITVKPHIRTPIRNIFNFPALLNPLTYFSMNSYRTGEQIRSNLKAFLWFGGGLAFLNNFCGIVDKGITSNSLRGLLIGGGAVALGIAIHNLFDDDAR